MAGMSSLGLFAPLLVLLWGWLVVKGGPQGRMMAAGALVLVLVSDQLSASILKPLFGRPRPYGSGLSFPSSHATNTFAQAIFFARAYPRLTGALLAIATAVSFSRVYLGKHYPLDVLAGAMLGLGCGYVGYRVLYPRQATIEHGWQHLFSWLPPRLRPRDADPG